MSKTKTVTVKRLNDRLEADFDSGKLFYKPIGLTWWDTRYSGKEGFLTPCTNGYLSGTVDKVRLLKHRVLFALYTGRWPIQVDHLDRDKTNNSIQNLREVVHKENHKNVGIRSNNTSGKTGVHFAKREKLWRVYLAGKELGYFKDKEEAIKARVLAEKEFGFVGD